MKKSLSVLSLLFGLFLCVTVFSACSSSDDEKGFPFSNFLIGTWESIDIEGDYYILEFKADGSFYQAEFWQKTEEVQLSLKGTYEILSVSGNTYEVSILFKEIYYNTRTKQGTEIVNETGKYFFTLTDNNNIMAISGDDLIWNRKK